MADSSDPTLLLRFSVAGAQKQSLCHLSPNINKAMDASFYSY